MTDESPKRLEEVDGSKLLEGSLRIPRRDLVALSFLRVLTLWRSGRGSVKMSDSAGKERAQRTRDVAVVNFSCSRL